MKTAYQYIRKSTEDQSNFSISGQQLINEEWARKKGIRIVRTFIDDGYSAKDFNRPQWKELEAAISKSKVDYLIIMKYDRLIRNVIEGLSFVEKLEQKWKITLVSVMENYSIDIHDPYFFKHRADMFVDADFERRRISDRTKFGMWSGRSQGRFLGVAPYGYKNSRDKEDKPVIVVDLERKKHIVDIFTDYVNDVPQAIIVSKLKKEGFSMTGKEAIRRIISNPAYAGLIAVRAYKDDGKKIVKGLHEPIVSEDLFWKAYYKLQEKIQPVTLKLLDENLPLRGFLKCQHCEASHTGAKCKGKLQYYHYYWCNKCRGKNFSAKRVHDDIEKVLNGLSLSPQYINAILVESEKKLNETIKDRSIQLQKVSREHLELKSKLNAVEEKYFENKINDETYQKWHQVYTLDVNRKEDVLNRLRKDENVMIDLFRKNLPFLTDLNNLYKKSPIEYKQTFLRDIFPGCLTALDSGYRTPFVMELFALNMPSIKGLVEFKKEGDHSILGKTPYWEGDGSQIEHFLLLISKLTRAA